MHVDLLQSTLCIEYLIIILVVALLLLFVVQINIFVNCTMARRTRCKVFLHRKIVFMFYFYFYFLHYNLVHVDLLQSILCIEYLIIILVVALLLLFVVQIDIFVNCTMARRTRCRVFYIRK